MQKHGDDLPIGKKTRQAQFARWRMAAHRRAPDSSGMPAKRSSKTEPFTTLTLWREHRGLTQEQVGNKLGLGSAAIHKWESGKVVPNVDRIRQLAEIYGTTPDALFFPPEPGRHADELRRADAILRRMSPDQADRWLAVAEDLLGHQGSKNQK